MRYTTVIDISEYPGLYRNKTAVLVYLHLCLKAGYHDNDRDQVTISIRHLASDIGVTVSAVRHALKVLHGAGLLERPGQYWHVKKWVEEQTITTRAKTKRDMQEQIQALERKVHQEKLQQASEERRTFEYTDENEIPALQNLKKKFGL